MTVPTASRSCPIHRSNTMPLPPITTLLKRALPLAALTLLLSPPPPRALPFPKRTPLPPPPIPPPPTPPPPPPAPPPPPPPPAPAPAADFFVAPAGDDHNPGTLDKPFATVQRAQDAASPGDTVFL